MLSKPNYNRFTISITIYLYNSLLKYSKNFNYILFYLYCYTNCKSIIIRFRKHNCKILKNKINCLFNYDCFIIFDNIYCIFS